MYIFLKYIYLKYLIKIKIYTKLNTINYKLIELQSKRKCLQRNKI